MVDARDAEIERIEQERDRAFGDRERHRGLLKLEEAAKERADGIARNLADEVDRLTSAITEWARIKRAAEKSASNAYERAGRDGTREALWEAESALDGEEIRMLDLADSLGAGRRNDERL
jgi:hypothetical protein